MLSITATDILAVADPATLKHPPTSLPSCTTLVENPTASTWAADNSVLYLASAQRISRYDPSSNRLEDLHILEDGLCIQCLVCRDKASLIFCAGDKIHVLECATAKISQTYASHKRDILSLSLSNDSTLLASASTNSIHIHNLSLGSHTILRGLPSGEPITVCVFHLHTRTRLLVAAGKQLLVYDTTRASSPLKTIPMNETVPGEIVAIACSPFSKTLVAVATSSGEVGLIDLDKDKGLFRTLNLKVPLTTAVFSPEGAGIYFGTENGKLFVVDLRGLDKPPKSVIVSESGNRIDTLCVQKKSKNTSEDVKAKATPGITKSTTQSASKTAPSPIRPRVTRLGPVATPARKAPTMLKAGTPKQSPVVKNAGTKRILSPTRDPLGNSPTANRNDSISASASPKFKQRSSSAKASSVPEATRPSGSTTRKRKSSTTESATVSTITQLEASSEAISSISNNRTRSRSRTVSSTSLAPSEPAPSISSRSSRTGSSAPSSRRKHVPPPSPAPPVPPLPAELVINVRKPSPIELHEQSRTPTPDLPEMDDPVTPIPSQKKKKGMAVLGLGTPEVKAWIKAGSGASNQDRRTSRKNSDSRRKGGIKSVGFRDEENDGLEDKTHIEATGSNSDEIQEEREKSLSMQISPRRPIPPSSSGGGHGPSQSLDASPLRPRAATVGTAHELLRTIVKDVMYDFQKETKAEMMGLHLDLVRMGRGWKQELRTLMEEYVGDLGDLREENRRLREENDRLRRGY